MFKHFQCFFTSNFTRTPHLAGTVQNFELAKQIHAQWKEFGLDSVELSHYDVLLSYPNKTQPNYISIIDEDGNEVKKKYKKHSTSILYHLYIFTKFIIIDICDLPLKISLSMSVHFLECLNVVWFGKDFFKMNASL